MKNLLEYKYFKIGAEKRIQTRNWAYQLIVSGRLVHLQSEVRNMVMMLLAKIIKNGWFDIVDAKNAEHRGIL